MSLFAYRVLNSGHPRQKILPLAGRRRTGIAVALVLALGSGGCTSVASPPDRFYNLSIAEPSSGAGSCRLPGVLLVNRPVGNSLTGELGLVYRPEPGSPELRRHVYHLWAEPPTVMIQAELAAYLRKLGVADTIITPNVRARADYALNGRLVDMHRVMGDQPHINLAIDLSLVRLRDRKVLVQSSGVQALPAADIASAVKAYELAALALFDGFLEDCQRVLKASP